MSQQPDDLSGASSAEDGEGALPLIELETLLSQPPSWRKRFTQLGLLLAALVVVLAAYWGLSRASAPSVPVIALQPTSPPPTVNVVSNVNYGVLTINGQPQRAAPPLTFRVSSQPPYTITLNAPPFQPLTCSYPPPRTSAPYVFHSCDAGGVVSVNQQASNKLEMLFTLADLPAAQQQQINTLITHGVTMQQTLAVPAQSVIAAGLSQNGTATTRHNSGPLSASVSLIPSAYLPRKGLYCFNLTCIGAAGFSANGTASVHGWQVLTPVTQRWRFTTASGQVVSDVTFSSFPILLSLVLSYTAATGWRLGLALVSQPGLSAQLSQLFCDTGIQMLTQVQSKALGGAGWGVNVLHDRGAAGCALELTQGTADEGHFVWRFGALLAGDASAHQAFPTLPVASPAELAAVGG
ncbi:MAG TPA: hypothetical protein VKT82_03910 [Ktedonobacterales bacterium]|nr:hypothetical protein [Ktedonobacterales bacterium]